MADCTARGCLVQVGRWLQSALTDIPKPKAKPDHSIVILSRFREKTSHGMLPGYVQLNGMPGARGGDRSADLVNAVLLELALAGC